MKLAEFRGDSLRERIISALDWSRKHKVRAVVYGVCMILLLEYLSLPNIRLQELEKSKSAADCFNGATRAGSG